MELQTLWFLSGAIFLIGYIAIVLEHKLRINKSGTAILTGVILWLLTTWFFTEGGHDVGEALGHETQEIFGIVVFLLAAMTIVEVLVHYHFFTWIQHKIIEKKISQTKLFWLLGALTFIFSAFLDNLTTTLIMIQIGRKIYKDKDNFLIFVVNTVIAANAGGAASPIGDVTTIMLWLANKFTAVQVISIGILPAIAAWVVPQYFMGKKIKAHETAELENPSASPADEKYHKPYWPAIILGMVSFTFPVAANLMGLPPFLGLLAGVGLLWVFIDYQASRNGHKNPTHEGSQIVKVIQKTDITTLKFFIGILLAVGALSHIGLLGELSLALFGADPSIVRLVVGNTIMGAASSVFDNVPLVAAAIKMFTIDLSPAIWVLLAITAGTGGSMLVVGSAAGVAAMGQVKELTFGYYLKKGTIPAILGYIAGVFVWIGVYAVFFA